MTSACIRAARSGGALAAEPLHRILQAGTWTWELRLKSFSWSQGARPKFGCCDARTAQRKLESVFECHGRFRHSLGHASSSCRLGRPQVWGGRRLASLLKILFCPLAAFWPNDAGFSFLFVSTYACTRWSCTAENNGRTYAEGFTLNVGHGYRRFVCILS